MKGCAPTAGMQRPSRGNCTRLSLAHLIAWPKSMRTIVPAFGSSYKLSFLWILKICGWEFLKPLMTMLSGFTSPWQNPFIWIASSALTIYNPIWAAQITVRLIGLLVQNTSHIEWPRCSITSAVLSDLWGTHSCNAGKFLWFTPCRILPITRSSLQFLGIILTATVVPSALRALYTLPSAPPPR